MAGRPEDDRRLRGDRTVGQRASEEFPHALATTTITRHELVGSSSSVGQLWEQVKKTKFRDE
jgi:hypothetical protein